jgi:hypothetical protein
MRKVSRLAGSYRIILGDTCTICRAVSRITFPADRPPQLPIAGCRAEEGCRCKLPAIAPESPISDDASALKTAIEVTGPASIAGPPTASSQPLGDWSQPAPITEARRKSLANLKELYRQQLIQGVRIIATHGCCPVCQEVAASIYDPAIAPPIPVAGCADGWNCRCMYAEQPLPLDDRGRNAMRRVEAIERERELRRAGVPLGGPRWMHLIVIALAIVIAITTLATAPEHSKALLFGIVLAACAGTVAILALRRLRPIPSPPWTYIVCGAGIALLALTPGDAVLSEGLGVVQKGLPLTDWTAGGLLAMGLTHLATAQGMPAAWGALLLLLGLVDLCMPKRDRS